MEQYAIILGKRIGKPELAEIRSLLSSYPKWHRSRLSVELCHRWNLLNPDGTPKGISCRRLLLRLERSGLVILPERRQRDMNVFRTGRVPAVMHDTGGLFCDLCSVEPLRVVRVSAGTSEDRLFNHLVSSYHYLGLRRSNSAHLKYLVYSCSGRVVGCFLFTSAAWKTRCRDEYIGWDHPTREQNLRYLADNCRFLVPPWVRIACLASRMLSLVTRRLSDDWKEKYGHPIHLVETFVDTSRFRGTCYRAANWRRLGRTTGRTRNDRYTKIQVPPKDVYVFPLSPRFREELCR